MSLLLREYALEMLGPSAYLGEVKSVKDPENRNRVQVRFFNTDGVADQDSAVWARVAVPFAGSHRGAFLIPNVGDEVVVVFLSGDSRFPVVIGSLWNGRDPAPETLGGSGESVDRWTITGKAGTRIAIVEESAGNATISFSTPGNLSGTISDANGGSIEFTNSSHTTVRIDSTGITVDAKTGTLQLKAASEVTVNAPSVTVSAPISTFSGIVQCDRLVTPTVVASTYTPGAGNVW
jgi:uncharacterized protein involved in type VI secretion and phage assembly